VRHGEDVTAHARLQRQRVQPGADEHALAGGKQTLIRRVQVGGCPAQAVRLRHRELAQAGQPGARPGDVAVPGPDLVDQPGQIAVAFDLAGGNDRERFLKGRRQRQVTAVAILEFEQLAIQTGLPAPALLPQFRRLHPRQQYFLPAEGCHLRAKDRLNPAQHPQAQRQPGVDAGRQRPHQPGADGQTVALQRRVRRGVAQGPAKKLLESHCRLPHRSLTRMVAEFPRANNGRAWPDRVIIRPCRSPLPIPAAVSASPPT